MHKSPQVQQFNMVAKHSTRRLSGREEIEGVSSSRLRSHITPLVQHLLSVVKCVHSMVSASPPPSSYHGGAVSSVRVRDPPPPPCPPGPLSYQGSIATGHTYGGAKGARKIFFIPLAHVASLPAQAVEHPNAILEPNLESNAHPNPQPAPNPTPNPTHDPNQD